jgi:two-component sensor histidine kinase/ligand-binding sensor domain-containing protein
MNKLFSYLMAFVFVILPLKSISQIADLRQYEFGSEINTILQHQDGSMLIGTKDRGLILFDGQTETVLDNELAFFKDNNVQFIFQDSGGSIWISTELGGLGVIENGEVQYLFEDMDLSEQVVVGMIELENGEMVVFTRNLATYLISVDKQAFLIQEERPDNQINDVLLYEEAVWVGTSRGILILDLKEMNYVESVTHFDGVQIYDMTTSSEGLVIGTDDGIFIVIEYQYFHYQSIENDRIGEVYDVEDNADGNLLLSTNRLGLIEFEVKKERYQPIQYWDERPMGQITQIYTDSSMNIWFVSPETGLYIWKNPAFRKMNSSLTGGFRNFYTIYSMNDGSLWAGVEDGMLSFKPHNNGYTKHYPHGGISVWDIAIHEEKILVLGSDTSLYYFDEGKYRELRTFSDENTLVNDVKVLSNGELWVGSESGIFILKEGEWSNITLTDGLTDNFIWHIFEDSFSRIWISTNRGVTLYENGSFRSVDDLTKAGYTGQFRFVEEDRNGNLWMGGLEGLVYYCPDVEHENIRRFNNTDGLLVLDTQFLFVDLNNTLWQGSSAGIQALDINNFMNDGEPDFTHYSLSENGFGVSTYHNAIERGRDFLWFGSKNGLYRLDTNSKNKPANGPLLKIASISSFKRTDQNVLQETRIDPSRFAENQGQVLTLASSENDIKIQLKGIDYADPGKIQYSYKFDRTGSDWSRFESNSDIRLINISPGEYTLLIKAKGLDGYESASPVSLSINVVAPFWQTSWFYGLLLIFLIGVYYIIDRIKYQLYERDHFKILVEERTQNLSNALKEKEILLQEVHHRIKNNLAVISGLLQLQTINIANEEAQRILMESQLRIKSIALIHEKLYQNDTLANINFRKYIEELVEVIADSYNFEGKSIDVKLEVDNVNITLDQSIPCGLILNELVSNSFEHAFKGRNSGELLIRFKEQPDDSILFMVKDDGIGFPDDYSMENSSSLGVTLVHTLVQQLQGEISMNGKVGTEYKIIFKNEGY